MNKKPRFDVEDSYGDIIIHGLELKDGTYLDNHHTELRHVPTGTEFIFEINRPNDKYVRVFSWGEYGMTVLLRKKTIQEMYDDDVLEVIG